MAKRGRPDAFKQRDIEGIGQMIEDSYPDLSHRQKVNKFYQITVILLIKEAASDIPGGELLMKKSGILEQLGRMNEQDGFCDEDILNIAGQAGQLLLEGEKAHDVEQMIRNFRMECKNDPSGADTAAADDV